MKERAGADSAVVVGTAGTVVGTAGSVVVGTAVSVVVETGCCCCCCQSNGNQSQPCQTKDDDPEELQSFLKERPERDHCKLQQNWVGFGDGPFVKTLVAATSTSQKSRSVYVGSGGPAVGRREAQAQNLVPAAVPVAVAVAGDKSRTGAQIGVMLMMMEKSRSTPACCSRGGKM